MYMDIKKERKSFVKFLTQKINMKYIERNKHGTNKDNKT